MPDRRSHRLGRLEGPPLDPGVELEEDDGAFLEAGEERKHDRPAGGSDRTMRESESGSGALRPCLVAAFERMSEMAMSGCVFELPMRSVRMAPIDGDGARSSTGPLLGVSIRRLAG